MKDSKYEDALERARQGLPIDEVFPELKESKDERIRNLIYCLIRDRSDNRKLLEHNGVSVDDALAYLEKQKDKKELDFAEGKVEGVKQTCREIKDAMSLFEPKDLTPFESTFRGYVDSAIRYCLSGEGYQQYIKERAADLLNLERQKENQSAEWKPQPESLVALMYAIEGEWEKIKPTSYLSRRLEDLYEGLVNTFNVDESFLSELPKTAYTAKDIEELRVLKDKIEASMEDPKTKPMDPFNDELQRHQDELYDFKVFAAKQAKEHHISFVHDFEWNNFCAELLSYFNERQKPAEWSEEDEKALERAIDCVRSWEIDYCDGDNRISERLKSIRPQPKHFSNTYHDIIHDILDMLKDMDFTQITPEHRVSLLNDIRVKCKNTDECAAILDEPHWKPSESLKENS